MPITRPRHATLKSQPAVSVRMGLLLGLLPGLLLAALPGSAWGVPFHPDVLSALKADGRLAAIAAATEDARTRGLDQPPSEKHPWLRTAAQLRSIPDRQAIVILVDFSDNVADVGTYPKSHYEEMLFSVGSYPTGSMRDWYLENSYGQFNVTGAVTVWLRMPQLYSYYVDGQAGFGTYPQNAQKLAEVAVVAADPYVDFSQFDNDGPDGVADSGDDDGMVDALFIVHAGPGRETTGSDDDIHSHAWNMSVTQVVDGVGARSYSMEPEDGKRGVFGHEFGHVLGLPDLYDTDYSSSGAGYWCMMSSGSWGGGGATPVHFLSWCKARLGFLEPTIPLTNVISADIPQVETDPVAYTLWTAGYPNRQFFMVENRQQVGADVSVPGEGLILCHIDENVSGNSDDWHPLVMIEQADGNFDLQYKRGSDAGDPFPGTSGNRSFAQATTPNSLTYAGAPTQVAVENISDSGALMTADLIVENEPKFKVVAQTIHAFGGNGDGDLDPGESWDLTVTARNIGLDATNVTGTASSSSGSVTVVNGACAFGDLGPEVEAPGSPAFSFLLSGAATADGVPLSVTVSDPAGHSVNASLVAGVNDPLQVFQWTHAAVRTGYGDQWHLSTQRNHTPGGSYSWKCGAAGLGDYGDRDDAALYSIVLPLGHVDAVSFWHWIDAEDDANWTAWDGGIIEASVDGGPWELITPDGGYPYTIISNPDSPFGGGTPCFSGTYTWTPERIDLAGLSGDLVQLRFRFGTDGAATEEGWYIDDVTFEGAAPMSVEGSTPHAGLWLAAPRPNPSLGPVTLEYRLPSGTRGRFTVLDAAGRVVRYREIGPADGVHGNVTWDGRLADGRPAAGGIYFLRLEEAQSQRVQRFILVR